MSVRRMIVWAFGLLLLASLLPALVLAAGEKTPPPFLDKIEPELLNLLSQKGSADWIVTMAEQADLSPAFQILDWDARGRYVLDALRKAADRGQAQAKALLEKQDLKYQTFVAGNELYVWAGDRDAAEALARLPQVASLRATRTYKLDPIIGDEPTPQHNPQAVPDWGILDTHADQFWGTFGMQGQGITVANIDTGVQWDHPALVEQFKCPGDPSNPACWADPSNICGGSACDNAGHGTHTMGTMVASDSPDLPYIAGMAPQAQWIACKGCEDFSCSDYALNTCADWILAPGGDPANRPHVVNNSWGGGGCYDWYLPKVQAWRAAGTFPAFSAGNNYTCNSLGSPGDYQESFASASHRSDRFISDFSSKGPSCFGDDPYTKPNISAPGESICSAVPTDGWDCSYSGTSMASPHTSGAVALLWSCNPSLIGQIDTTFEILQNNADAPPPGDCGAPPDGEGNYTFGYGYLNVFQAGLLWCGETGTLAGQVTDADTSDPIEGATIQAVRLGGGTLTTLTDETGSYSATAMVGTYDVSGSKYGYVPQTVTGVEVVTDTVTTLDLALAPAAFYTVDGTVTDAVTGWPLYVRIDIDGYPGGPVWTDPESGYYSIELAEGILYTFYVIPYTPGYQATGRNVGPLTGDVTEDFQLEVDSSTCSAPGYVPQVLYSQDFEASDGGYVTYGYGSSPTSWQWGAPTSGPGYAHSGANVWATNLWGYYSDNEDSYVESPDIDMSPYSGQGFSLSWWQWLQTEGCCDYGAVEVSNDGGASWAWAYGPTGGDVDLNWAEHRAALDASYAVSNFRVRFHLWTDGSVTYPGYYVDDVAILGDCQPPAGGLVIGNVYDANTGAPLVGAQVSNDSGQSTTTASTPDDPALDDGFYTLFSPPGDHEFTASKGGGYGPDIRLVPVVAGDAVRQDFALPAGWLSFAPLSIQVTVDLGASTTVPSLLSNDGAVPAAFEFLEKDKGFDPEKLSSVLAPRYEAPEAGEPGSTYAGGRLTSREPQAYQPSLEAHFSGVQASVLLVASWEATQLRAMLLSYPDLSVVDYYDARTGTPSLDLLLAYDTAIVMSNSPFADPVAMGNVLADYVDAGGTVIQAVPTFFDPFGAGWGLRGRFVDEGYSPFIGTGDWWLWADLGAYDPSHPIMEGVASAGDTMRQVMEMTPDAAWVASWTDDEFVATKGSVVALNTYLADGYGWAGDIPLIVHNSVIWLQGGGDVPWLSESPITGTVPANMDLAVDVILDAGVPELTQPGTYYAAIRVQNDTPYDLPQVPVTMTVVAPPWYGKLNGTVTGLGYCDADPAPLEEAEVAVEGSSGLTWTLESDAAGYYQLWLDEANSPLTVTVTYPEHEVGQASGVVVTGQQTTTVDFDLRWLKPCLSVTPENMAATLEMGMSAVQPLTITNAGGAAAPFELQEKDRGFQPVLGRGPFAQPKLLVPAERVNAASAKGLELPPPAGGRILAAGDVIQSWPAASQSAAWGLAYTADDRVWVGEGWGANAIHEYRSDGTPSGRSWPYPWNPTYGPADDAFNWNTGMVWTLDVGGDDCIHEMDPGSGYTGNVICGPWYISQRGVAYDPSTDTWYVGGWNEGVVYHIDSGGALLDSAYVGLGIAGLAYNPDTLHLFVIDNYDPNRVYVLDTAAGYGLIGQFAVSEGFGPWSGAGLEFDCDGNLWAVDQNTNTVYQFESGETASLCAADVPWLIESPITGTVPADDEQPVDVTFDAGAVAQPGIYYATLMVKSDDPVSGRIGVPMTLTVSAPPTWGKLNGTVTGQGYCDADPAPLEEAELLVESSTGLTWTLVTDAAGYYQVWLDEANSPLTVTVTHPEHEAGQATGVVVTGQQTTTVDFDLRWLKPCLSVSPGALSASTELGETAIETLTLANAGGGTATFEIGEMDRGFQPARGGGHGAWLEKASQALSGPSNRSGAAEIIPGIYRFEGNSPSGVNILACSDSCANYPPSTCPERALQNLGESYTLYFGDWYGCETALSGGDYDLAVIDNACYFPSESLYTALDGFLAAGGQVMVASFDMDAFPGNSFWADAGVSYVSDVSESPPPAVYRWDPAHPAVTGWPVDPLQFDDLYIDDGDRFDALSNADALAGYTTSYASGEGAFALRLDSRALVSGFCIDSLSWRDQDFDGTTDCVEVWQAGIAWLLNPVSDVPWLAEDPVAGTVAPDGGMLDVEVTFDAGAVIQPGQYYAALRVQSDDPVQGSVNVPVTMTVSAPPDWGVLTGAIRSLGQCDAESNPLTESYVVIQDGRLITVTPQISNVYTVWLEQGSYTVSAYGKQHQSQSAQVTVTAQQTTTLDFDLRLIAPCLSTTPASLEATLQPQGSQEHALQLVNSGAGPATFQIREAERSEGLAITRPELPAAERVHTAEESKAAGPDGTPGVEPTGSGGPDPFGYIFRDSQEPGGPTYDWVEIAPPAGGSGIPLGLNGSDDGYYWPLNLPWAFNFYGIDYSQISVQTNGALAFVNAYLTLANIPIPGDTWDTDTFIAHWWDDMYVSPGEIYYLIEPDRIIIEYFQNSGCCTSPDYATWEVILLENGSILMQYQDTTTGDWRDYGADATVGIQGDPWTGLQYSYNSPSLADGLAICFAYPGSPPSCRPEEIPWLAEEPPAGTIEGDTTFDVQVTFTALPTLPLGVYTAALQIDSGVPSAGSLSVPVTMTIAITPGVEIGPDSSGADLPGETVYYVLTVTNTGNYTDTFHLSVGGDPEWPTDLLIDTIPSLGPGEAADTVVAVEIPGVVPMTASDVAAIVAASTLDPVVTDSATLTTNALLPGVRITPPQSEGSGLAGEAVSYTLVVTNEGNFADDFSLTVHAAGWPTALSTDQIGELEPGAVVEVLVTVQIPGGAAAGDSDLAAIVVASLTAPGVGDAAVLRTAVTTRRIYIPVVLRNQAN